ncbi:hypothetical protein D9M68_189170 [compost metagenome]|jgi:hypothetical protein
MLYPTAVALRKIRTARSPRTYFVRLKWLKSPSPSGLPVSTNPSYFALSTDDAFDFKLVAGEQRYRDVALR